LTRTGTNLTIMHRKNGATPASGRVYAAR